MDPEALAVLDQRARQLGGFLVLRIFGPGSLRQGQKALGANAAGRNGREAGAGFKFCV